MLPLHAQGADMSVSVSLARLLKQAFPREYRSRRDEMLAERGAAEAGGAHALLTDASAGRVDGGDVLMGTLCSPFSIWTLCFQRSACGSTFSSLAIA